MLLFCSKQSRSTVCLTPISIFILCWTKCKDWGMFSEPNNAKATASSMGNTNTSRCHWHGTFNGKPWVRKGIIIRIQPRWGKIIWKQKLFTWNRRILHKPGRSLQGEIKTPHCDNCCLGKHQHLFVTLLEIKLWFHSCPWRCLWASSTVKTWHHTVYKLNNQIYRLAVEPELNAAKSNRTQKREWNKPPGEERVKALSLSGLSLFIEICCVCVTVGTGSRENHSHHVHNKPIQLKVPVADCMVRKADRTTRGTFSRHRGQTTLPSAAPLGLTGQSWLKTLLRDVMNYKLHEAGTTSHAWGEQCRLDDVWSCASCDLSSQNDATKCSYRLFKYGVDTHHWIY